MASSKNRPGPFDRAPGVPRAICTAITRTGARCKHPTTRGRSGLCKFHLRQAKVRAGELKGGPPPAGHVIAAETTNLKKRAHDSLASFQLNTQALAALSKLGLEPNGNFDPKTALLATVESAWRQARVWEAMLASIPQDDYEELGVVPIPGQRASARGARLEIIQRNLTEATKASARISKLAIDAGIEERLVRLAEEQSALIADTVRAGIIAAIGALRLTPQAEAIAIEAATQSAAHHLRLLAAGGEEVVEGIARRVGP